MSSAVIKAGDSRLPSRGLYSLDLRDIARKADEVLSAAKVRAERMLEQAVAQAEAEREVVHQVAYDNGYQKGLAEGRQAGHAAALAEARERFAADQSHLITALSSLLQSFTAQRDQLYLTARRDVIVLAIAVARRIARKLETVDDVAPEAAAQACADALAMLGEVTQAQARVHPEDWAAVQQLAETLTAQMSTSGHLRIVKDASVGRGGVIVETADSTVDATVASRVDRIADELVADWRDRLKALSFD